MERFATIPNHIPAAELQRHIRIDNLPEWCAAIHAVLSGDRERGDVDSIWGTVRIRREVISEGVRFTLPASPTALQWTITAPRSGSGVTIHVTANAAELPQEECSRLEQCVESWRSGLEGWSERVGAKKRQVGECVQNFGGFG